MALQLPAAASAVLDRATVIYLGFSGGLDSMVLLDLLAKSSFATKVIALHVNHQLQADAESWSQHCESICDHYNIPCELITLKLSKNTGLGIEAEARNLRYQKFADFMHADAVFLTAHHADDQVETILHHWCRGSGLRGLRGILSQQDFAAGQMLRPLLGYSQEQLQQYAAEHDLAYIEDPSNADPKFSRNFLRHEVIPLLKQRWPALAQVVAKSSAHLTEEYELIAEIAAADLAKVQLEQGQIAVKQLRQLSLARQKQLLRLWCQRYAGQWPNSATITRIIEQLIPMRGNGRPMLEWQGARIQRRGWELFIEPYRQS